LLETEKPIGIGTEKGNNIVLSDRTVSRTHCSIATSANGHLLRDHDSTNGTLLNGTRVIQAFVEPGAILALGETQLRVEHCVENTLEQVPIARRYDDLLGYSLPMRRLYSAIGRIAGSDTSVLLTGETGTGKGLVAEVIQRRSPRAAGPFVVVDCGALATNLIQSELFRHVRGAVTGAETARVGAFELASGGTVFLDEIGEMPLDLQPMVLRALENRSIRRLGGTDDIKVDIRVIAATNRDVRQMVNRGQFRADL
jgi:transcriptional regulator with GAF, ATPase, and Fis domain